MSERHFFHDRTVLVDNSLSGFVATRSDLHLKRSTRVVHRISRDVSQVALISGGGAGHEPGVIGMVGQGVLDAAVIGDIFASPRAEQILAAISAVPSRKGTILITPNYTGDVMNFSLARYMAKSQGINNVELVVVGDDISVPKSHSALVGRRCLAGITLVCKILGAAAEKDFEFHQIIQLGRAMSSSMASVCAALAHCHIPGRDSSQPIQSGQVEIGLGIHNEKGVTTMDQPQPDLLINLLLDLLLKPTDAAHDYLKCRPEDELVILANNQGGVSALEMGALLNEALTGLAQRGIRPLRAFCGSFMGSMNMPGFSITLLNISTLAKSCNFVDITRILELIDATHGCSSWPTSVSCLTAQQKVAINSRPPSPQGWMGTKRLFPTFGDFAIQVNPERTRSAIRQACTRLISIEKNLTLWDTYAGDGDCGDTCTTGAKAILLALDDGLGKNGNLIDILRRLTEIIQTKCGGTLGAITAIFLGGMTTALCDAALSESSLSSTSIGLVTVEGLQCVKERTRARVGHRTVMDAMIPFCATLSAIGGLSQAVEAAKRGAESTRSLKPRLGRAAYVSEQAINSMTPDPGAMAFVTVVQGIQDALSK